MFLAITLTEMKAGKELENRARYCFEWLAG